LNSHSHTDHKSQIYYTEYSYNTDKKEANPCSTRLENSTDEREE